jgi:site-specific recombinase XerD
MITMRIVFAVHRQPRTRFARRRIIPDQAGRQHVGRSCRIPLNRAFHDAVTKAGINKHVSLHTLRHCFATHLLEKNVDIRVIQVLLGHRKLETTAVYAHVAARTLDGVESPLDLLQLKPPPA